MIDTRAALDREAERFDLPPDAFERQLRRRERRQRNRRVSAVALAVVLTALSVTGLTRAFRATERPAVEPTPTNDAGIFSGLGGWIAYESTDGIWAMDPNRPGQESRIQLSTEHGEPLAWSGDGSKLLISKDQFKPGSSLSVLNADGSETLVVQAEKDHFLSGGSISPDGSTVIYADEPSDGSGPDGIYAIDATGGTPRLLLESRAAPSFGPNVWWMLLSPTFSPDGSQVAYIEGMGDNTNTLRVMNADGSAPHTLLDDQEVMGRAFSGPLVWSPDGGHLAFGMDYGPYSIYVVRADGSGVTRAITGAHPQWSPDGSRISYNSGENGSHAGALLIADVDGTHVQWFDNYGASGPWNPMARAETRDGVDPSPGVHFAGLPPEGAQASMPEVGELVLSLSPSSRSSWSVYADGRMIWQTFDEAGDAIVVPQGADANDTGYVEQRLTPEGVQLLRSRILATGLFDQDLLLDGGQRPARVHHLVRNGDRLVSVEVIPAVDQYNVHPTKETPAQARALAQVEALVADPAAWLPATAWADREIRAFVPSRYWLAFDRGPVDAPKLPASVHDVLLRYRRLSRHACQVVPTSEARAILQAFADSGVLPTSNHATYIDFNFNDSSRFLNLHHQNLHIHPALPEMTTC